MADCYSQLDPPPQVEFDNSGEASETEQGPLQEADINYMLSKYHQSVFDSLAPAYATNGDSIWPQFSDGAHDVNWFMMWNNVLQAQDQFNQMPPDLKTRFGDPATLADWLFDPANADEAVDLGLVTSTPAQRTTVNAL